MIKCHPHTEKEVVAVIRAGELLREADPWTAQRRRYWQSEAYRERYKPMVRFLYRGGHYRASELVRRFGFRGGRREISEAVEFARRMGHPLLSGPDGYYMARRWDDMYDWTRKQERRARSLLYTLGRCRRYSRLKYQLSFDLFYNSLDN